MILGSVWKHQRTINSCYGVKFCDFGPNQGLGIFITDMDTKYYERKFELLFKYPNIFSGELRPRSPLN